MDIVPLPPLLDADEPSAFETLNGDSDTPFVFLCDHASHRVPRRLGDLGLSDELRRTHIGWDIGAAELARHLAAAFKAPLFLTGYSRLVIDCNRPLASDGSIPRVSAGIEIAANRDISDVEKRQRQDVLFHPYQQAIAAHLDRRQAKKVPTALFAIHSFTPDYPGEERPWQVDFAYHRDRRLAGLLIDNLKAPGILVGDNLPYAVEDESDYAIPVHGEQRGLPHVLVEIRQDTLGDAAGIARWADLLTTLFDRLRPAIIAMAQNAKDDR
ncbi:MAG: N-formylglutamate amidohydrolase [Proteobacteria bacterium]|nr:N-formylglutamate amidohydrolase [Pseudomonadota bacterium]